MIKHKLHQSLYLKCLVVFFVFVWLLPNHYPPWGAFHNDAFVAFVLLLVAGVVFYLTATPQIVWHWQTLAVLACILIPLTQYLFGQISWFGTAWINMAYLLGLACAMALGAQWEKSAPGRCGDFLFTALLAAGVLSVVIGICQWLGLGVSAFWVLESPGRPFANLSQANQAASLYVLCVLGCAWLYRRKKISGALAGFLTALLLLGLAMSGSRTGWLNAALVGAALVVWAHKSKHKRWALAAAGGWVVLTSLVVALPWLSLQLLLSEPVDWASRGLLNSRDVIWQLVWDAITRQPFWGYGWGQTIVATLNAAPDHQPLSSISDHAHNLFLDLLLWNGLVLGAVICVALSVWMLWMLARVKTLGQLLLVLFLAVLGLHAMTEYPLHYAYFLLPAGLVAGMLGQQLGAPVAVTTSLKPLILLFVGAGIALAVTVRDYIHIETGITAIRFESALIKHNLPTTPPDIWVLTDLRAVIVMARWQPQKGTPLKELNTMKSTALAYASGNNMLKMAQAYGLNDDKKNATHWLQIACHTTPKSVCQKMQNIWTNDSRLAGFPWPIP